MVGLLFARSQSALAKELKLKSFRILAIFISVLRSSFPYFCAGYSECSLRDDSEAVSDLKGKQWSFSNTGFDQIRERLERDSKWRYAGGVQLILTNAQLEGFGTAVLD